MGQDPKLELGRRLFAEASWREAHDALTAADTTSPLAPDDLELLGRSAYMLGQDDAYVGALERAFHAHVENGSPPDGVRCAFWIGHSLIFRGRSATAFGWFARAERLVDSDVASSERGYALLGRLVEQLVGGDAAGALQSASEIVEIGQHVGDDDLVSLGLMEQGHALVRLGRWTTASD